MSDRRIGRIEASIVGIRLFPGYNGPAPFDPKDPRHLVIALGLSALGGATTARSHHEEAAKNHAERDDPDGCPWLCDLI